MTSPPAARPTKTYLEQTQAAVPTLDVRDAGGARLARVSQEQAQRIIDSGLADVVSKRGHIMLKPGVGYGLLAPTGYDIEHYLRTHGTSGLAHADHRRVTSQSRTTIPSCPTRNEGQKLRLVRPVWSIRSAAAERQTAM